MGSHPLAHRPEHPAAQPTRPVRPHHEHVGTDAQLNQQIGRIGLAHLDPAVHVRCHRSDGADRLPAQELAERFHLPLGMLPPG